MRSRIIFTACNLNGHALFRDFSRPDFFMPDQRRATVMPNRFLCEGTNKMVRTSLCLLLLGLLSACAASVSIKNPDGSTVSGKMMNGSMSYSVGPACVAAQPNPITVAPTPSPAPVPMQVKRICDGTNCVNVMAPSDVPPQCVTQIATVRGDDITTYFSWLFGGGLATWALAAASGT